MTASSASSKAKAKFSSRNLSAVYKAPALRGVELAGNGVSSSGLNRMLVLKAPVRGGVQATTRANAVAAPTPINTPSLRKENNGQDVNVSLVPAGKSGGWGAGSDGAVEREDAGATHAEARQATGDEVQRPLSYTGAPAANVWRGGVASLSRTSSSSSGGAASVMPSGGGTSGRWGDDAVEEDLVKSEMHQLMERKREFPELQEHRNEHERVPVHVHPYDNPHQQQGYSQDARAVHANSNFYRESRHSYGHPSNEHGMKNGHAEMVNHQRPWQQAEYGQRSIYHSNQDARYDSSRQGETRAPYDRSHAGDGRSNNSIRFEDHSQHNNDLRDRGRGCDQYYQARQAYGGYGPRYYREYPSQLPQENYERARSEIAETDTVKTHEVPIAHEDNQAEHRVSEKTQSRPNSASVSIWKATTQTPACSPESSTVWKMSDSEVRFSKHVSGFQRPAGNMQQYPRQPSRFCTDGAPTEHSTVSQVRILKRNGPRMLFDPKSGTMVEVEEKASSRRSNTTSPAPRDPSQDRHDDKPTEISEPSSILMKDGTVSDTRDETETDHVDALPTAQAVVKANESGVPEPSDVDQSHEERLSVPSRKPRTRSKEGDSKKKRLTIGGKPKRVVVAYQPVVKKKQSPVEERLEENGQLKSDELNEVQPSNSQKDGVTKSVRVKTRKSAARTGEDSLYVPTTRTKLEKSEQGLADRPRKLIRKANDRTKSTGTKKSDRSASLNGTDHTQKTVVSTLPVKSTAVSRFDQLKELSAGDGVVFVDEEHNTQDFDDDDAPFTTVKSRRTILIERKRQREQIIAALSGFHERGGVKRSSNRVVVPTSSQRFGKKGLFVGFRSGVKDEVALPVVLPPLEKPFIDATRPPAHAPKDKEPSCETTEEVEEPPLKPKKLKKKEKHQKSKARGDREKSNHHIEPACDEERVTTVRSNDEGRISTSVPVEDVLAISTCVSTSSNLGDEAKSAQVVERLELYQQRVRRDSGLKKGMKKVYVVKQTAPTPTAEEVSNEISQRTPVLPKPLRPAPAPTPDPAETLPVQKIEDTRASVSRSQSAGVQSKDHKSKTNSRKGSASLKEVAKLEVHEGKHSTARAVQSERQKMPDPSPASSLTKAVKAAAPVKDRKGVVKPKAETSVDLVKEVEMSRAEPPAATRRPSTVKTQELPHVKPLASTVTKKIYKKVYVVKAASAADTSSAA